MAADPSGDTVLSFTSEFRRDARRLAKKYPGIQKDLQPLLGELEDNGRPGDKVPGLHFDVHKVRVKNSDARKGKSGGYRVIYHVVDARQVVLVTIYSKTEQGDVDAKTIRDIIKRHRREESEK